MERTKGGIGVFRLHGETQGAMKTRRRRRCSDDARGDDIRKTCDVPALRPFTPRHGAAGDTLMFSYKSSALYIYIYICIRMDVIWKTYNCSSYSNLKLYRVDSRNIFCWNINHVTLYFNFFFFSLLGQMKTCIRVIQRHN